MVALIFASMLPQNHTRNLPFRYKIVTASKLYTKNMKKSNREFTDYIQGEEIDLKALRRDIELKRQQYQHETFAQMLNIERASFTMKLAGTRGWKLSELLIIASRLGKDYHEYLKTDSHSDAAG